MTQLRGGNARCGGTRRDVRWICIIFGWTARESCRRKTIIFYVEVELRITSLRNDQ